MNGSRFSGREPAGCLDEGDDAVEAVAAAHVGEDVGALAAHALRVRLHHLEIGADIRREVDLVDDEKVGAGDAGAAFPRHLLAAGDVDNVNGEVGELRREGGGEVVTAQFDEDDIEIGKARSHLGNCLQVDRRVLANGGMRAAAGLDAEDALFGKRLDAIQDQRVLLRVDVVGDDGDGIAVAHRLAEHLRQRGLAGADRAADPDAKRPVRIHVRNTREYWVS